MKFVIAELNGETKEVTPSAHRVVGLTLGQFLKSHTNDLSEVIINEQWYYSPEDWNPHVIKKDDVIQFFSKVEGGFEGIIASLIVSLALSALSRLFAPKPKKKNPSSSQPSLGIAGVQNTIAPGTPKFLPYGIRRVFGHIIAGKVDIAPDNTQLDAVTGSHMSYSIVYFMGVGPVHCISEVQINGTHIEDFNKALQDAQQEEADAKGTTAVLTPVDYTVRLGTQDQSIISGHEFVHQVYHVGSPLQVVDRTKRHPVKYKTTPIIYTTQGSDVDKVTLFFNMPEGLWNNGGNQIAGNVYPGSFRLNIQRKKNSDGIDEWEDLGDFRSIRKNTKHGLFWKVEIENPSRNRWDYKIANWAGTGISSYNSSPSISLYDVMETRYIATAYPGSALLELHGIANTQITSFEGMNGSALVEGRLVDVLQNGIYVKQFTRNRVWIVRDILLGPEGLGNRVNSIVWDDASGAVAAAWYEMQVPGFNGVLEQRDYCDVIINSIQPGWDHIKTLLFEGRAVLIPSSGKLKYVVDRDVTPRMLYTSPGNIVQDTLQYQRGYLNPPINTLRAEFPNITQDYRVVPTKLVSASRGTNPERAETISYTSIVRESQVSREMNFYLQKTTQVKKHWTWESPRSAIVSEPFDVVKLGYQVSKGLRGVTGVLKGTNSTPLSIVTGKEIYLEAGFNHTIHIAHQGQDVEERLITNATGMTWSVLNVSSPFSFTPTTGDRFAASKKDSHVQLVQIDSIEHDNGKFVITGHEHIPSLYEDVVNSVTDLENTTDTTPAVRPLLGAQAILSSGVGGTYGTFNVIPGFDTLAGTYSSLAASYIILDTKEPGIDRFFENAYVIAQTDTPVKILTYTGSSRKAVVDSPGFVAASTLGGFYKINWYNATKFSGFRVEGGASAAGPFYAAGITPSFAAGTSWSTTAPIPGTYTFFRFTPFDIYNVDNTLGRWVVAPGATVSILPSPPAEIDLLTDDERDSQLDLHLNMPLERNLQQFEIQYLLGSLSAVGFTTSFLNVQDLRNESTTETMTRVVTTSLAGQTFGSTIFAKVAALDFYGNKTDFGITFEGSVLSSAALNPPGRDVIDDVQTVLRMTAGLTNTVYSANIEGGLLGTNNEVNLTIQLFVTPFSVTATSLQFAFSYGGVSIGNLTCNISDGASKIADRTPYWLNLTITGNNSASSQLCVASKYGTELPANSYRTTSNTLGVNSAIDQTLLVEMSISGETQSFIDRRHVILSQLMTVA